MKTAVLFVAILGSATPITTLKGGGGDGYVKDHALIDQVQSQPSSSLCLPLCMEKGGDGN